MYRRLRKILTGYIPALVKTGLLSFAPGLYDIFEINPTSATLMITNRCNMRCIMCRQWREPCGGELSTESWKKIIDDLRRNGIKNIHFTGGEPLLRKDLVELAGYASSLGFTAGLTTNGMLLGKEIAGNLADSGLRSVALSIDAVDGEYERIRGVKGAFEKVKNALRVISDLKAEEKIDAYISFTLLKDNIGQIRSVKALADSFNVPVAICTLDKHSSIFNLDENKRDFWIRDKSDYSDLEKALEFLREEKTRKPSSLIQNFPGIDYIGRYFRDPLQKAIPCVSSQDRVIIDPYGKFLGGCMAMGNFGNINEIPFAGIKKGARYRKAKKNMFYKKCPGCSCGYQFNIKCYAPLVLKDLSERIARKIPTKKHRKKDV